MVDLFLLHVQGLAVWTWKAVGLKTLLRVRKTGKTPPLKLLHYCSIALSLVRIL